MACEECHWLIGHDYRCPNYVRPESKYICSYCEEGILPEEEYIENEHGNYVHLDCINGVMDIINFLGAQIKTMEE